MMIQKTFIDKYMQHNIDDLFYSLSSPTRTFVNISVYFQAWYNLKTINKPKLRSIFFSTLEQLATSIRYQWPPIDPLNKCRSPPSSTITLNRSNLLPQSINCLTVNHCQVFTLTNQKSVYICAWPMRRIVVCSISNTNVNKNDDTIDRSI